MDNSKDLVYCDVFNFVIMCWKQMLICYYLCGGGGPPPSTCMLKIRQNVDLTSRIIKNNKDQTALVIRINSYIHINHSREREIDELVSQIPTLPQ